MMHLALAVHACSVAWELSQDGAVLRGRGGSFSVWYRYRYEKNAVLRRELVELYAARNCLAGIMALCQKHHPGLLVIWPEESPVSHYLLGAVVAAAEVFQVPMWMPTEAELAPHMPAWLKERSDTRGQALIRQQRKAAILAHMPAPAYVRILRECLRHKIPTLDQVRRPGYYPQRPEAEAEDALEG